MDFNSALHWALISLAIAGIIALVWGALRNNDRALGIGFWMLVAALIGAWLTLY
jgi:inner membrane protein involved in colicin E2 resistance